MKLNLNASSAHTWTQCTAQPHYLIQYADKIPPQSTEFSRAGVQAHKVVENLLKGIPVARGTPADMLRHASAFVARCRETQSKSAQWWSEYKVDLFYFPGRNGYVDYACYDEAENTVRISDFKYGEGVAVNAFENLQLAIYARSFIEAAKVKTNKRTTIIMAIDQPRVRTGQKYSTWEVTWAELVQFTDDRVRGPAEDIKAKALTLRFEPGDDVCKFCPAATFCGLKGFEPNFPTTGQMRAQWMLGLTPLKGMLKMKSEISLPAPTDLSQDAISHVLERAESIAAWLSETRKYALAMALAGKPLPGTKVVLSGGGHRKWSDEEKARGILLRHVPYNEVLKLDLVTPKQAEPFEFDMPPDEWKRLTDLIVKPEGGPVLVPASDPRPSIKESLLDLFEDESEFSEDE